jgi:hypothetical protein
MAAGLQIFNSAGQLQFEVSDYLGRVIGYLDVGTVDGSYTYPGPISGQLFAAFLPPPDVAPSAGRGPDVSVVGATIYWTFDTSPLYRIGGRVIYGMY